ncbi:MAG TPA: hypothetical protein P5102_17920, partial [Candidatus Competibacteraceae bacterium]|nr:hypothetical protein [Candidatus Contendobacter sp.]HRZ07981.1 hypothetical protein [Candidatus Competibacteraceae bacterium]
KSVNKEALIIIKLNDKWYYTKLEASITLGGGVGGLQLKNENGVIMRLESRTQGLQLNVGSASGIKVTMQ